MIDRSALDGDPDARDAAEWMRRARRGDLEGAWELSDRIHARQTAPDWSRPRHLQRIWDGSPLEGRRVLIRCYHGLGDTIQFVRYAPMVRAAAREVIVWAQPALLPLLRGMPGIDLVLPLHDGAPDADYDVDIEVMELPYAFRTTTDTIPRRVPYIDAHPLTLDGDRPRIGVVWRAGGWDERRSVPFDALVPLIESTPASWFALQVDARSDERHACLQPLCTRGILRTARIMAALDLVITIDSMSAHLAGALAVPVWTLLPHGADWRWMEERADSPWYPTMRLFRQPAPGMWSEVIEKVSAASSQWAAGSLRCKDRAARSIS